MTKLRETQCCACGVEFAIPKLMYDRCYENGGRFYCPNGHSLGWNETEKDRYRREAERLKQQMARKDDEIERQKRLREMEERRVSAYKGQVTKLKKRASAGVCPCCNRHFENLHRHMEAKHPDYVKEPDDGDNVVELKAVK